MMCATVIVPVYNRKDQIKDCINSLLSQTFEDYEIIIIDDGSTDGTKELLQGFSRDPKIKIILLDKNHGLSLARNHWLQVSQGDLIAYTDSDAKVHPHWIAEITAPFQQDPSIMVSTGKIISPKPASYWELVNKGMNFIRAGSGFTAQAVGCNMAFRRTFLMKHPFDKNLKSCSDDLDLSLQCAQEGSKIFYNEKAVITHFHRSSLRSTMQQSFNYGYFNTYVRLKHGAFPYINYGTWALLSILFTMIVGKLTHHSLLVNVSKLFLLCYLFLIAYLNARCGQKNWGELMISYPGFLLRCLMDSWGNICYIVNPLKIKK